MILITHALDIVLINVVLQYVDAVYDKFHSQVTYTTTYYCLVPAAKFRAFEETGQMF